MANPRTTARELADETIWDHLKQLGKLVFHKIFLSNLLLNRIVTCDEIDFLQLAMISAMVGS